MPDTRDDVLQTISQELGQAAPAGLAALDAKALAQLGDALRNARRRQRLQLSAAASSALQHIPLLLRAPVKKILGLR
ncbi:hypothetical protein [Solimonas marina]|uniref:Uncharacterized protein n=1 Tax=Solimonas marina TaxID=2714601 RepID=A0A969W8H7_9GAMM|nr:hypothetical protein [Solimonas marina]NKF21454.1 hypothetical protein [Solimonas marina]